MPLDRVIHSKLGIFLRAMGRMYFASVTSDLCPVCSRICQGCKPFSAALKRTAKFWQQMDILSLYKSSHIFPNFILTSIVSRNMRQTQC